MEIRSKRLYAIRSRIDTFLFSIIAIYLYSSIDIELENLIVEKRSLFSTLVDLYKFLGNYLPSTILSI
jgi:hypothetical protein